MKNGLDVINGVIFDITEGINKALDIDKKLELILSAYSKIEPTLNTDEKLSLLGTINSELEKKAPSILKESQEKLRKHVALRQTKVQAEAKKIHLEIEQQRKKTEQQIKDLDDMFKRRENLDVVDDNHVPSSSILPSEPSLSEPMFILYQTGTFFSPSKYATEKQPFGPFADTCCYPNNEDVKDAIEYTLLAKKDLLRNMKTH